MFVILRLPPLIAGSRYQGEDPIESERALQIGLAWTFRILSLVSLVVALVLLGCLHVAPIPNSAPKTFKQEFSRLLLGFSLIKESPVVPLTYLASMAARVQTIAVSQFVPVLVNAFYLSSGRCRTLSSPHAPTQDTKEQCHAAFALASSVTGTVQLTALLVAPLAGHIAHRYSSSMPRWVLGAALLGMCGFAALAALPEGDPRHFGIVIPAAIALGISQTGSVVLGLALCATARSYLAGRQESGDSRECAGALAGVSSFAGGRSRSKLKHHRLSNGLAAA